MEKKFIDTFEGRGTMVPFVDQVNEISRCMNNISVIMPTGYSGEEPTLTFKDGALVFDFGQALVFTLNNVKWVLTGSADFVSYSAQVENGKLVIRVHANSV
jgi:hypothetical protein